MIETLKKKGSLMEQREEYVVGDSGRGLCPEAAGAGDPADDKISASQYGRHMHHASSLPPRANSGFLSPPPPSCSLPCSVPGSSRSSPSHRNASGILYATMSADVISRAESSSVPENPSSSTSGTGRPTFVQPPFDLRLLDYVSQVDSNLLCPICHAPFADPKRLECDHIFCDDCLQCTFEQTQRNSSTRTCPTCRRELQDKEKAAPLPRILSYMLDELVVKCPNSSKGCAWSDKRVEVQDHIELYCDLAIVPCPEESCDQTIYFRDSKQGCLHYSIECEDCGTSLMRKDLQVRKHLPTRILPLG
jgi:hypothetical protein